MLQTPPSAHAAYRLCCESEEQTWLFDLVQGESTLGSALDNEVTLPLPGISRRHAKIHLDGAALSLEDLGSKNGTFVEGRQVSRAMLEGGMTFRLGSVELRVEQLGHGSELAIHFEQPMNPFTSAAERSETLLLEAEGRGGAGSTRSKKEPKGARDITLRFPNGYVVGTSPAMQRLYRQMAAVCRLGDPALLHGETGVGKEMLARTLHDSCKEGKAPYVVVNCAAIPDDLLEAEMFGVVKGAATGVDARIGHFARAEGGTLFLDEIGELSPSLQAKLLRVLQEGEIQPVGGRPQPIDVWVVAATNVDLESGRLRRDLYYRFAAGLVEIPSLRRCRDDIPPLVRQFCLLASAETGVRLRGLTARVLERLQAYDWPGNVRQLTQLVRRLVALDPAGGVIDLDLLPDDLRRHQSVPESPTPLPDLDSPQLSELEDLELKPKVEALEKRLIREAMRRCSGHQIRAAELLGLSRSGLAKKLKRYGLSTSWAQGTEDVSSSESPADSPTPDPS